MDGGNGVSIVTFVGIVQLCFQLTILAVAVNHILQRRLWQRRRFLINPRELPVSRIGKSSGVGAEFIFQQCQQGRFTAAIFTYQANFLPWINGGRGIFQQDAHAATNL
ncbi:Uncharacterised protein [Citrobacter braakii]|nr:Uncharacterised protein [Citrobacter braakii]